MGRNVSSEVRIRTFCCAAARVPQFITIHKASTVRDGTSAEIFLANHLPVDSPVMARVPPLLPSTSFAVRQFGVERTAHLAAGIRSGSRIALLRRPGPR